MAGCGVVGAGPHFEASNAGFTGNGVPVGDTQTVEVEMGGVGDATSATPAQTPQDAGDVKDTAATQLREMPVV